MTSFERDMGDMVRESHASEAKKTLAMNCVRATGRLANGSRGNVESLCDAIIAQTPIMLEMYLEQKVAIREVDAAIAMHLADCPLKHRGQPGDTLTGLTWQQMLFTVATRIGWPGAFVLAMFALRDPISALLLRLGGGLQ